MAIEYKDYYAALGVKKDASADDIKRAYRRLAREHHPDLKPERHKAQAESRFKELNEAYEVLSDPKKKAKYDQLGPGDTPEFDAGPRATGGGPAYEFRPGGQEDFSGFSDFFEGLFGGGGRQGFGVDDASRSGPKRGQDVEAELPLSLEEALRGGEKRLSIMTPVLCPSCGGSGRKGRGFCPACGGVGETQRERTITAHLPRHIVDGTKLRLRGQGGSAPGGGAAGDLYLRIRLRPHPRYKVSGSDLETVVTVMPWTAALGGEASVPTLEGALRIKIPAGTHAGRALRVPGKGLGKEVDSRGDLYVVVRIDIPESADGRMERLYREMKGAQP
ncbi:MAG: DnaJ domain-containing protein [Elusimicrobia bacterium]|nr:DnaJ domain-containing protein [Elusimicrobiota bacterium]